MNSGSGKGSFLCLLILALLTSGYALAQEVSQPSDTYPAAPTVQPTTVTEVVPAHRFWDRKNALLFTGIAVGRTLDYTSTLNMQRRGREEMLLPDDVVNNRAGFAALEAAGTASSIGVSYLLHRTGHHRLERWLSMAHLSVANFGAARNYALRTKTARP